MSAPIPADIAVSAADDVPMLPATVDGEALIAKALEHNVTIDTLERLVALRDKMKAEQARAQFFAALSGFQASCPVIPKTKTATVTSRRTGTSYKYHYAPLDVIVTYTAPLLSAHGLSATFDTRIEETVLISICTVHHVGGHSETSTFRVPIDADAQMNDAQKVASASTYAKRYAYCNALGILTGDEDDDAKTTGEVKPAKFEPPKRKGETLGSVVGEALARGSQPPESTERWKSGVIPFDERPLTDEELAALDREDAKAEKSTAPETLVMVPRITAKQAKRAHAILNLALKDVPAEQREKVAKLARTQLYLKLTRESGVTVQSFEDVPRGPLYDRLCNEWIDRAATWAAKHA